MDAPCVVYRALGVDEDAHALVSTRIGCLNAIRTSTCNLGLLRRVRTGIADLNGTPHYFASQYDEGPDDYSDNFKFHPVGPEFMRRAVRNWDIYRAWERKFHNGEIDVKTHPGHGGIDAEYDKLTSWLDEQVKLLEALPSLYKAKFRALPNQEELPASALRELEVIWSPSPA